jgi:hypothetical protein
MLFSRKMAPCVFCKGKRKIEDIPCGVCNGSGRVDEGRPYTLYGVYEGGVINPILTKELQTNKILLLKKSCIASSEVNVSNGWERFPGCPSSSFSTESGGRRTGSGIPAHWNSKREIGSGAVVQIFENAIQKRSNTDKWKELRVYKVVKDEKSGHFLISVHGKGCNCCKNLSVREFHNTSRIWFFADETGIRQRCFCKKKTTVGRRNGVCSSFRSQSIPLSVAEVSRLFPSKVKMNAIEKEVDFLHSCFES